ncbi:MAG: Mini-ribonuclease 3 [Lachnospirales bacterium]
MVKKMIDFLNATNTNTRHISEYSSLGLAYIGDVVFEIFVRTYVINKINGNVNDMDSLSRKYVKASSQANFYHLIYNDCSEEERSVLRRGRNAKIYTKAKHASVSDYKHATGLEALFGYLYLKGEISRLEEIFTFILNEENNGK